MKNFIYGVVIATLLSGCGQGFRTHTVNDSTQSQTIILTKQPNQENIYGWILEGSGEIEGEAQISVMLDEEPYLTEELSGIIDFQWQGDWYANDAEIVYTPTSVTGGEIQLKYQFHD
ncbi:hypothetical protein [[Leptolyngbya] sp. PCC 7376]|uniref:hypothetical protein n=1 Tax=[Leptolyngbya] sp. PCC 7376 TaxID=111781 RepID=UPI00135A0928|nr:hypothetical protein [[Leptolyngbya] sp. PCC 7376]